MSDQENATTPPKTPAEVKEAVIAALAALSKLLDGVIGATPEPGSPGDPPKDPPKDPPAPKPEVPVPTAPRLGEATAEAKQIRARYDGLTKWILGAFGALGLLIFGTVPFANLNGVPWPYVVFGLIGTGLGLVLVVWAATRSWEPVSAGLGQLQQAFEDVKGKDSGWLYPNRRAVREIQDTISREPQAHLGPGMTDIASLIAKIADLESKLLTGGGTAAHVRSVPEGSRVSGIQPLGDLNLSLNLFSDLAARERDLEDEDRERLETLRAEIRRYVVVQLDVKDGTDPSDDDLISAAIAVLMQSIYRPRSGFVGREVQARLQERLAVSKSVFEQLAALKALAPNGSSSIDHALTQELGVVTALVEQLPTADEIAAVGATQADIDRLELYLDRRHLLLSEATVLQVGARFTVARRLLVVGGALTLAGGVLYAFGIANPQVRGPGANSLVVASVQKAATSAWDALVACRPDDEEVELISGLSAVLTESDDRDGLQDGPFSIVVNSGSCAGTAVEVADHQGGYALAVVDTSDGSNSADTDESADEVEALRVLVTLFSSGKAWADVTAACELERSGDLVDLGATLRVADSDATDADHDGPFTVEISDDSCANVFAVEVADGEGTYRTP